MERDEEGFAVVPEQHHPRQGVEESTINQNELCNSNSSAAFDSARQPIAEVVLGPCHLWGCGPRPLCQGPKRHEQHAAAVYRFAQDILAVVSFACLPFFPAF
jgi:hypothetical protein